MNIKEKLVEIQSSLKAPKSNYNKYGNYPYRSCEDILEGVKPLLKSTKTVLVINDTIEQVADRIYVKATATLMDSESDETVSNSAYARESADVKGMADAQVTGAASSYARKYALNGLFVLDDTKDDDNDVKHDEKVAKAEIAKKEEAAKKTETAKKAETTKKAETAKKAAKKDDDEEIPPEDLAEMAYPSEDEMREIVHKRYDNDEKNLKGLLGWAETDSIDKIKGNRLITAYNKALAGLNNK